MNPTFRLLAGLACGGDGALLRATRALLNYRDAPASITQLRQRLHQQRAFGAPRMTTLDTESRLVIELSRSPRPEEREEALESGEELWKELCDKTVPILTPTRTAMRINVCSAMRRCALVSRDREAADLWTARFAERTRTLSPEDFMQTEEQRALWRDPRKTEKVRPGTGITAEDLAEDAREAAEKDGSSGTGGADGAEMGRKPASPMQEYRRQVLLDHPALDYAFRHGRVPPPGPRYTG